MPTFWVLLKNLEHASFGIVFVNLCIKHEVFSSVNQIQTAVPKYKKSHIMMMGYFTIHCIVLVMANLNTKYELFMKCLVPWDLKS